MLRCPADSHPLVSHAQGAASFAVCGECAGVWIDGETLARSAPEADALPLSSRRPRGVALRRPGDRGCPSCARGLAGERVEGIEIDRCTACGGVWLDAGEYDAVRARLAPPGERPVAGGRAVARPDDEGGSRIGQKVAHGALYVGVETTFALLVELLLS